jgi:hypothetical protein
LESLGLESLQENSRTTHTSIIIFLISLVILNIVTLSKLFGKNDVINNDVLSNADIEFYKDNCLLNDCGNNNPFTNDCFFNNNHDIWCEKERILEKDKINLQSFLNTIPKDAYIILKSCDVSGLSCSQAVRFE